VTESPAAAGSRVEAEVVSAPIDVASLIESVSGPSRGAIALFLGTVRDHNRGRRVERIHYEAFAPMARKELASVCEEAVEAFGLAGVAAVHRTGTLAPGEASLVVAVASAHRDAAYRGSRWIVEEVKRRLPVWKREAYADGSEAWLDGHPAGSAP
jgi:molybdopterin synthase catalytic subunit